MYMERLLFYLVGGYNEEYSSYYGYSDIAFKYGGRGLDLGGEVRREGGRCARSPPPDPPPAQGRSASVLVVCSSIFAPVTPPPPPSTGSVWKLTTMP